MKSKLLPQGLSETEIKNEYCTLKYNVLENVITLSDKYTCLKSTSKKMNWIAWKVLGNKMSKRKAGEIFPIIKCFRILTIGGVKFKACK